MKKRFVIANTPVKLPIQSTILYTFLLHHFQVSGIWWGVFITLFSLLWIIVIVAKWNEEKIDFNDEKIDNDKKVVRSKFAERLQKLMDERKS
jgi:predicted membrane protein